MILTLAIVAHRISTDVSFTAMLQNDLEEALSLAGIALEMEEKTALQKILALPPQSIQNAKTMFTCIPWAW